MGAPLCIAQPWVADVLHSVGAAVCQHAVPITFVDSFNDSSNIIIIFLSVAYRAAHLHVYGIKSSI